MEDTNMHHVDMVHDVVAGLLEVLRQEKAPTENATTVPEAVNHVANAVQITHQQLDTQLQQMQAILQAMHMQYSAKPHHDHQDYGSCGYHGGHTNYRG